MHAKKKKSELSTNTHQQKNGINIFPKKMFNRKCGVLQKKDVRSAPAERFGPQTQ